MGNSSEDKWHLHFLEVARIVSLKSKDVNTKVGCVLVGPQKDIRATGFNGPPRGVEDKPERLERPLKYVYMLHAEQNAVIHAGRERSLGCTAYTYCSPPENGGVWPCVDCTKTLINAGIARLVYLKIDDSKIVNIKNTWRDNLEHSQIMLKEAGIEIIHV